MGVLAEDPKISPNGVVSGKVKAAFEIGSAAHAVNDT